MWFNNINQLNIPTKHHTYNWLRKPYALTQALRAVCKQVTLEVVTQQLATATYDEQAILQIQEDRSFIREVLLLGDNSPCVQARVVAPLNTYQQFQQELDRLGNNFIGEAFLFKHPHCRSSWQYAAIGDNFARRSLFTLQTYKLLVTEIILANIPPYLV